MRHSELPLYPNLKLFLSRKHNITVFLWIVQTFFIFVSGLHDASLFKSAVVFSVMIWRESCSIGPLGWGSIAYRRHSFWKRQMKYSFKIPKKMKSDKNILFFYFVPNVFAKGRKAIQWTLSVKRDCPIIYLYQYRDYSFPSCSKCFTRLPLRIFRSDGTSTYPNLRWVVR